MLSKNLTPNLVALGLLLASFLFDDPVRDIVASTGLFALSGALTNWLAVHMLFERVPGLYGSGVIVLHFEEFKAGILRMVREQLLDPERIGSLLSRSSSEGEADDATDRRAAEPRTIDLGPVIDKIDLDAAFDQLVATINESSFGPMLAMVGGEAALQPLREPFRKRMRTFLTNAAASPRLQAVIGEQVADMASSQRFAERLDSLLRARLDELTPEMVRDIMQLMIKRHLGWLVVWGGVFGGLIGLLAALLRLGLG